MIDCKIVGFVQLMREANGRVFADDHHHPTRHRYLDALEQMTGRPVRPGQREWPKPVGDGVWYETAWRLAAVPQAPDENPVDQRPPVRGAVSIELFDGTDAQQVSVCEVVFTLAGGLTVYVGGWSGWEPDGVERLFSESREYARRTWGLGQEAEPVQERQALLERTAQAAARAAYEQTEANLQRMLASGKYMLPTEGPLSRNAQRKSWDELDPKVRERYVKPHREAVGRTWLGQDAET